MTSKTETKPTPSDICLSTATDQTKGKSGTNTTAESTVCISNTVTAADSADGGKVKKNHTKDSATVRICNQTDAPEEVEGGCGAA